MHGCYDSGQHKIELVPICLANQRQEMESLIDRLKAGKFKYRGAERTFATRFSYSTVVTTDSLEGIDREVGRLLSEHPDWCGNENLNRLFLVYTPEAGYSSDDESSPYFVVKRRLLEAGIPCQMVDTGTLHNPDWKDLNLSLNIIAKCGVTPWVLPARRTFPTPTSLWACRTRSRETDKRFSASPMSLAVTANGSSTPETRLPLIIGSAANILRHYPAMHSNVSSVTTAFRLLRIWCSTTPCASRKTITRRYCLTFRSSAGCVGVFRVGELPQHVQVVGFEGPETDGKHPAW